MNHNIKKLQLPKPNQQIEIIETTQSILLVGANGSGKTRLGTWIEIQSPQKNSVHRISAQKSLAFPDSTTPQSIESAEKNLLFGHPTWSSAQKHNKWSSKPATTLLNDYEKLMVYLFSDETEANAIFKRESKNSPIRIDPPVTKIDLVKDLWEKILPHRELIIGGLRIQTKIKGSENSIYNSSEMSDGERVIFYLIGQCLAAPKNAIIIIDEPELHLHKSIQAPLWNSIEELRQDCLFVYLTHDVDFAASKEAAKTIWLKSFDGKSWNWELLNKDENLPEDLLLEVIGSRKPVVFVEGENGSFDYCLYREILSNFLVIPRGSCDQVIQSVKSFKANMQFHYLEVYGLIDRDRRTEIEINKLEQNSIFVLKVAEVENLFCTKEVIEIVSDRLARDPSKDFETISNYIFSKLKSELEDQVSLRASSEIKFQLNNFDINQSGIDKIKESFEKSIANVNIDRIYNEVKATFESIIQSKDYAKLLALYNRKSLSAQISSSLGLSNRSLPETVIRLMKSECKERIKNALKPYFGNFLQYIE